MFSAFSNITNITKKLVVDASSTITQSETVQNVKEKVVSIPNQTREYFYPSPEQHEMKSVVRLDDAFFVHKDIEEYITPGQQQTKSQGNQLTVDVNNQPVKPSGDALTITSWHEFGIFIFIYIFSIYIYYIIIIYLHVLHLFLLCKDKCKIFLFFLFSCYILSNIWKYIYLHVMIYRIMC